MTDESLTNNSYKVYENTVRQEMYEFIPKAARKILDVGCGVGNFGEYIKSQRDAEVWGVEADNSAAEIASQKLDKVYSGNFGTNLGLPERGFDCVVFNDVLEHMIDPYAALVLARHLLLPGGKVVASIPNVRYFGNMWLLVAHKSWRYEDAGILDRTHLRFFTEKSIKEMFEDQGYNIELMRGINPLEQFDSYFMNKFRILNFLALNHFSDMRWYQFAVVAAPVEI